MALPVIIVRKLLPACVCAVTILCTSCNEQTFNEVANDMAGNDIPCVFPENIPPDVVLLDAREKDEFEVSHLQGAVCVGYEDPEINVLTSLPRDTAIVVYCAIGYRSARIARQLRELGFTRVYNLWGGIFNWYNKGYVLYNADGATRNIHPYNDKWGKWLVNHE